VLNIDQTMRLELAVISPRDSIPWETKYAHSGL